MSETIRTRKAERTLLLIVLSILTAILAVVLYTFNPWTTQSKNSSFDWVQITSQKSIIHVGSNDSFATTQDGIQAGKLVLDFLENKQVNSGKAAIQIYNKIIPRENYGGEYSALQWFCQYLLATDSEKQKYLSDKFVASFYNFFAANDFANLKEYIQRKYKLKTFADQDNQAGQDRKASLEDFILFSNPRREEWEKTSKILSSLNLKAGQNIADIGSGPGYYTFKFSQLVGEKGNVFAIDTVQNHLNYVNSTSQKLGIKNIKSVHTGGDTIGLKANQVDLAFMCSLYHNIYAMSTNYDIDNFVNSIKTALKNKGTLVVVDNGLVKDSELPYHGPYIAKELIISQLQNYGFKFVKDYAFIPQRYVLVFQKTT
ncbi:MAG: class I SAM-dependent methyltransferase [Desmonostoc vinosum HA7617-LM4]|jgi:ubiquinone/menaquinone biosynthesis C-methylase UbiE|nr:class I SAM-dependent methyltransferase [Desmonostoc vinosum HA7617-LM4]